jgi:hypothetical protein
MKETVKNVITNMLGMRKESGGRKRREGREEERKRRKGRKGGGKEGREGRAVSL